MLVSAKNNKELLVIALGYAGMPVERVSATDVVLFCEDETTDDDPASYIRFVFDSLGQDIEFIETGKLENYDE